MKSLKIFAAVLMAASVTACDGNADKTSVNEETTITTMKAPFTKKYTNADYYTDGKFNQDVAMKAIMELLEYHNTPMTPFLKENIWVTDFG